MGGGTGALHFNPEQKSFCLLRSTIAVLSSVPFLSPKIANKNLEISEIFTLIFIKCDFADLKRNRKKVIPSHSRNQLGEVTPRYGIKLALGF